MTTEHDPNGALGASRPLAMRITDAAKMLSIGRTTVYQLINEGTLLTIKVGRRRLILTESIQTLCAQPAPAPASAADASSIAARIRY